MGYGSYSAAVAEVSVSGKGEVKVHRMVLATNCGHAVNPATIAAQVEGSVAYGFDSLQSEITVAERAHGGAELPHLPDRAARRRCPRSRR